MAFTPFASVDREALRWLRVGPTSPEFQLLSGPALLGSLSWTKAQGSLALAGIADRQFTIKRVGFLHPHVTVRRAGEERDLARLASHLGHHRIEFAGGARYDLKRAGVLVPAWQLLAEDGTELAHVEPVREGRRLDGGIVQVSLPARDLTELPLLLLLTWYFIVLSWREDEAVSEWTDHAEGQF
ncbi:MAG: hypothetical protein HKL79_06825 [Thermoplasmata archaeon]|nr:hypothetical protein [Thermoplasmata archaeon]